jgi:2-dehydro-3-deoxyglucarate aldolase
VSQQNVLKREIKMTTRLKLIEKIRKKIKNNKASIGTWQQIPHASISEILSFSGYDWIAIDMEHGSISAHQLPNLCRAIELGETLSLVRLSESTSKECKQALDAGAGGVIAPMIETAAQLINIKDFCCWPPSGKRGVGFSRANLFGKNFNNYKKESQSPLLIAQIEHINAVDNLKEILNVEGLDAIIVGPYDLSASMGITGDFNNSKFLKIMDKIVKRCNQFNIPYGDHIVQPDPKLLKLRVSQGFRFIAYSIDAVFLNNSAKLKE